MEVHDSMASPPPPPPSTSLSHPFPAQWKQAPNQEQTTTTTTTKKERKKEQHLLQWQQLTLPLVLREGAMKEKNCCDPVQMEPMDSLLLVNNESMGLLQGKEAMVAPNLLVN